jgi:hypothetical protein
MNLLRHRVGVQLQTDGTSLDMVGLRITPGRSITAGDSAKGDVPPPGNYPVDDLGSDSSKWTWVRASGRPIEDVVVFPPKTLKEQDQYRMGEDGDYYGYIEGDTVRIHFKDGGVFLVKIVFQDRSIPPEIRLVLVAAGRGD